MKIHLHSDIHLEHADHTLPGGDVLILAGDICVADKLRKSTVAGGTLGERFMHFFRRAGKAYNRVLYVPGNHEHYSGNVSHSVEFLRRYMPDNATVMDQGVAHIDNWSFLMATMWTDCRRGDPLTLDALSRGMNDFRVIRHGDEYKKFLPATSVGIHNKNLAFFREALSRPKDDVFALKDNVFVVTHHAPTFASIPEKFRAEYYMNGGFASDLSVFILDHPQIKYWAHGHIHDAVDYMVGDCRVISNPRGYPGEPNQYNIAHEIELL